MLKSDKKKRFATIFLTRTAVIAAIYAALTLIAYPISFGAVQFRISEALTILPLFFVEAIPGLFVGCFIANIINGPVDMILGSAATLLAAIITFLVRKIQWGIIPPIVINAFVVPVIFLTIPGIETAYFFNVLTVGLGQMLSVCILGIPLYFSLKSAVKRFSVNK